jgi:hypothetical protein
MKYCFIAATDFWLGYFIFCSMVYDVLEKFKIYHCVFWCYLLQMLAVCKTREQGILKYLHTWLWNIQLGVGSMCWFPWTLQMGKLNTVVSSLVLGLNSSPSGCNLWSQIFIPPSDWIYVRRILFNFFFWISDDHLSHILLNAMPTPYAFFFWGVGVVLSLHLSTMF